MVEKLEKELETLQKQAYEKEKQLNIQIEEQRSQILDLQKQFESSLLENKDSQWQIQNL